MAETIRFFADQQFPFQVVHALGQAGVDVLTTEEAGLKYKEDGELLDFAHEQGRVTITHDHDFVALHQTGRPHAGIVYGHQKLPQRRKIDVLLLIFQVMEPEEM